MVSLWYRALSSFCSCVWDGARGGDHLGLSLIQASITHQPISLMFPITFKQLQVHTVKLLSELLEDSVSRLGDLPSARLWMETRALHVN